MCNPMSRRVPLLILLALLLLTLALPSSGLAMQSSAYHLDWFTPMTGTGGASSSANYSLNFTVGQTASGPASSPNYAATLGYWQNIDRWLFLPIVVK